jgi:hypothetical protein
MVLICSAIRFFVSLYPNRFSPKPTHLLNNPQVSVKHLLAPFLETVNVVSAPFNIFA